MWTYITGSQLILDLHLDLETSEHKGSVGSELGKTLKPCLQRHACREVAYINCYYEATHETPSDDLYLRDDRTSCAKPKASALPVGQRLPNGLAAVGKGIT